MLLVLVLLVLLVNIRLEDFKRCLLFPVTVISVVISFSFFSFFHFGTNKILAHSFKIQIAFSELQKTLTF